MHIKDVYVIVGMNDMTRNYEPKILFFLHWTNVRSTNNAALLWIMVSGKEPISVKENAWWRAFIASQRTSKVTQHNQLEEFLIMSLLDLLHDVAYHLIHVPSYDSRDKSWFSGDNTCLFTEQIAYKYLS